MYTIQGEEWGKADTTGPVDGARPAGLPDRPGKTFTSLHTQDIQGAQTSTRGLGVFANHKRREGQQAGACLNTSDIEGAKSGSLLKGINTKRSSNPLSNTDYQYPGMSECVNNNNPFSLTRKEQQLEDKKK